MADRPLDPEEPGGSSFGDILSEFEQSHGAQRAPEVEGREGTVVAVSSEYLIVDVGLKTEGVLEVGAFGGGALPQRGDKLQVSITGRNAEGYYLLSKVRVARPKDWSSLERAFAEKRNIAGVVTAQVKGGFSVDVGVRAFMPASRSGARDAEEMEQLAGKEITCRIIQLDVAEEDVVVDRRVVLEEEEQQARQKLYVDLQEGAVVRGTVRSLTDYGAFLDLGGIDGLLHVGDISWGHVAKPSDVLKAGDTLEVQVLKVDRERQRVSLGLKQLAPDPWAAVQEKYQTGRRVQGAVTRLADFGAFVELEPGVEGLIHLSELSWSKKVRKPGDAVKRGEAVEVVVLGVNAAERRLSLGLKQTLGDPWEEAEKKYPVGAVVEGMVTSLAKFGAFVELPGGIEGMVHVGDLSAEKRIDHPQEVLKPGQAVRAAVLGVDRERRRLRLGVKQLQPTSIDEYIAEHREGDVVTGRVAKIAGRQAMVELGDGIQAACAMPEETAAAGAQAASQADLSSLTAMLAARWKQGVAPAARREPARAGEVRSFRIVRLDAGRKSIELEFAG